MDVVSLKLAKNYTNEKLNSLPSNAPIKTVTFAGGIYNVGNDVVNGQMNDVVVKGSTVTNLLEDGEVLRVLPPKPGDTGLGPGFFDNLNLPQDKYLIFYELVQTVETFNMNSPYYNSPTHTNVDPDYRTKNNTVGRKVWKLDAPEPITKIGWWVYTTESEVHVKNFMIVKATEEDWLLSEEKLVQKYNWHNGTKSTNSVRLKSVGKNLFDVKSCEGKTGWRVDPVRVVGTGIEVSGYIPSGVGYASIPYTLKPNTQYTMSFNAINNQGITPALNIRNSNDEAISSITGSGEKQKTFMTDSVGSGSFYFYSAGLPVSNAGVYTTTYEDIQLEEGTTATPYEPYKESSAVINLSEPLRSVPSAKDEFNASTGVKTQRVGNVILDGDEDYTAIVTGVTVYRKRIVNWAGLNNYTSYLEMEARNDKGDFKVVHSTAPATSADFSDNTISTYNNDLSVYLLKSEVDVMPGGTIEEKYIAYLNQHPITLIYQLATPIVTKLPAQAPLQVFENGTVYVEPLGDPSETTLPTVELTVPIAGGNKVGIATHDYAGAAADWVLTSNEGKCTMLKVANAGGAANIIAPDRVGKLFVVNNLSGQTVTVKKAGGTGVAITNGKTAIVMHNGTDYIKITEEV